MALTAIRPKVYLYGSDTYTAWDANSLTTISALPSPANSGTSNAAWLALDITGAPIEYVFPEAEERTGNTYANLRITSVDIKLTLRSLQWDDGKYQTLATMLNKRYLYLEQGTYPKALYTTNVLKCLSVARSAVEVNHDDTYGKLKIVLTLKKRAVAI
jgi:hypothetical protein